MNTQISLSYTQNEYTNLFKLYTNFRGYNKYINLTRL